MSRKRTCNQIARRQRRAHRRRTAAEYAQEAYAATRANVDIRTVRQAIEAGQKAGLIEQGQDGIWRPRLPEPGGR